MSRLWYQMFLRMMKMNRRATCRLFKKISKAWLPPPKLQYSEWAEKNFILSTEDSSEPGKFNIDRAPYQIEMMDALNDPETHTVVFMTSAQIGKTTIEKIIIGYHIDQDPGPMMLVLPNKDPMAKDWSRDRLAPMIRDVPVLSKKVGDPKLRDGENSTYHKKFPGGLIIITGAISPTDLRSRPMRILLFDEVDGFSDTAEGDPIALASKRQMTFRNRKTIMVSTPTVEGASRIEAEYLKGTQEKWHLACPH
ncbi:MAG: phage terminase large subunit family protein, partial [Clostridiales bacterium]|nr:phage terminase large subunit family protein [Clostridiales bacterium]